MINILSISGSPVQHSSTDILLGRLAQSVLDGLHGHRQAQVSFVKLNSISFRACQSCGIAPTPKWCFYDDLSDVLEMLANCDCLLFGSPIYFDSVTAQAKTFIDRSNCIRPADFLQTDPENDFIQRIERKRPGAMVLVGGERGWFEGARRVIAGFFKWVEVTNEGMVTYSSPNYFQSGTVKDDVATLKKADDLGRQIAAKLLELPEKNQP